MNKNTSVSGYSPEGAQLLNPKKWEERTTDEKIEALRRELQQSRYTTKRVYELEGQLMKLKRHYHVDGQVMIHIDDANRDSNSGMAYTLDTLA